jgi:hypothetical protein
MGKNMSMHTLHVVLLCQAVLKRKTEEAEAARRKLRELTELQARVRRDKQVQQAAASGECSGMLGSWLGG